MIEIREPQKKEKEKIKNLWSYCFLDTDEFINYYFDNHYSEKNVRVIFKDKIPAAMLHLNKHKLSVREKNHNISYVVGVGVAPEFRGKGLMNLLIKNTLEFQYNIGEIFSILMPIETDIYLRYGYLNCFDISEYNIDLESIIYKKAETEIKKVERISKSIIGDLDKLYSYAVKDFCSYNIRSEKYWKNKFDEVKLENGELFLVYESNKPSGYFTLFPKNPDFALVTELVFTTKKSYQSILNTIKSHSTQFKKVKIFTPQSFEFSILANNNNKFIHNRKPFIMGRVINAKKVLDNIFSDKDLSKFNFEIEVSDNQIDANNFLYINKKGKSKTMFAKIDISALAQIYTKYSNVREQYLAEKFETDDLNFFEKLFGTEKKENFINEYF